MPVHFDHVGLSVRDLDAAAAFYSAAFDYAAEFPFRLDAIDTRGLMLRHPSGHRLELFEHPEAAAGIQGLTPLEALGTRGYGHFALTAPEIDASFARAVEAGARPVVPPGPSPEPGVRFAFLADPEGNLVELVERP
jgi:lactoylglutathione lyase